MRFWDSSAVVPLILEQPLSARARQMLREDPDVVIWWGTPVECASAFARLSREGLLDPTAESDASHLLEQLRRSWHEVLPGDQVRAQALRVLRLHPLRAGNSLQLAAALEWAGTPPYRTLVTFDDRLAAAAGREGFQVP